MLSNRQPAIAQALLQINAVGFSPDHPITFKSGLRSPVYVDNRRLPFHPNQWQTILHGFRALIEEKDLTFDALAGIAVGGVPHSAALGYILHKPSLFIRKESKGHGHHKMIEGGNVKGLRVLLIEDLVTTGGSALAGVEALRAAGAVVTDVAAIVSYGFAEADITFANARVTAHTLVPFRTILSEALVLGRFDAAQATVIEDWFAAPQGWAERHQK
ncbi:orotate phosphoribosyltransferase [bacterium]|nr:orotate phosphoribosyltransferase [bacterium]